MIFDRDHIVKIKTEWKILPKQWDFQKQGKKGAGATEFNQELEALKTDIYDKYKAVLKKHPDMPFTQLSQILKDYGKTKEIPILKTDKDFFGYLDEYMIYLQGEVSPRTIQKFNSVKKSLQAFIEETPRYRNLTFSMVDHGFKDAYVRYLRNQPARGKQKNRPEGMQQGLLINTEMKYIECLKSFLKWAEARNYNLYTTYQKFEAVTAANRKRKKQKDDIVTLTLPELQKFYAHDFSDKPSLDRVRDSFCFGAFTLQRWSDIERFDKSQLDGDVWELTPYKTKNKSIRINLLGYSASALDILKKYDYQLPIISLAKFNLYLKNAARIAGITKEVKITRYVGAEEVPITKPKCDFLGSHSARRSGVSILLNDYNMNPIHVMAITAHSDLTTLQAYAKGDPDSARKAAEKTRKINEIMTVVKSEAV